MHDLNFWFSCIMSGFQFSLSRQKRQQVSRCFASPYERPLQELLCHQDCSPHFIKNFPRPVLLFVIIYTFIVHFLNNSFIVCKQNSRWILIQNDIYSGYEVFTSRTKFFSMASFCQIGKLKYLPNFPSTWYTSVCSHLCYCLLMSWRKNWPHSGSPNAYIKRV